MVTVLSTYNTFAFGSVPRSFSLFHPILNFHLFQLVVHLWSLSCTCYTGRDQCIACTSLSHCRGQHEREATASHSHLFSQLLGLCDLFHCLDAFRIFVTYTIAHIILLITDSRLSSQFVAYSSLSPCSPCVAHFDIGAHCYHFHCTFHLAYLLYRAPGITETVSPIWVFLIILTFYPTLFSSFFTHRIGSFKYRNMYYNGVTCLSKVLTKNVPCVLVL